MGSTNLIGARDGTKSCTLSDNAYVSESGNETTLKLGLRDEYSARPFTRKSIG